MSEFKTTIQDLEGKLAQVDEQLAELRATQDELNLKREKIEKALNGIRELDGDTAHARRPRAAGHRAAPPRARGKGPARPGGEAPAKKAGCLNCGAPGTSRPCHTCGTHKCSKCGLKPYARHCEECLEKEAKETRAAAAAPARTEKATKKRTAAWRNFSLKPPAPAPAAAAASASDGKKKCEGCGQTRSGEFKKCETCGAGYCAEKCLNGTKDCPACRRLIREPGE